jgi:CHAT domain-containing protein/tetratricopeptide (TPR) repeat protein
MRSAAATTRKALSPILFALSALLTGHIPNAAAQSPFQFREAALLEARMMPNRGGFTDLTHFEENLNSVTPTWVQNGNCIIPGCQGPNGQYFLDLDNPILYQSDRWVNLLVEVDTSRDQGAFAVAGPVYERMVSMLKKARGDNSSAVALMLDHLAEYYLEARSFDKAYAAFQEAIAVRRAMLKGLPPRDPDAMYDAHDLDRLESTMHLADLLTRIGEVELGKGDLPHAEQHLVEAAAICSQKTNILYVGSIYAIYFLSLTLEREGKWKPAEELWQQSVKLREAVPQNLVYWDSLREMAAFYARRGDFHTAAQIAQKLQEEANQKIQAPQKMPYMIDSRPLRDRNGKFHFCYTAESDAAMKEILALDKWQTDGSAAATALLPDLVTSFTRPLLEDGSDAERAQLIAWYERRVFLHLSILLDGRPTQDQVDKAFTLIGNVQGQYLATIAETTAIAESGRNNPGVDTDAIPIVDELGAARDRQAAVYLASALDGKPFLAGDFAAAENTQRILSAMLSADPSNEDHTSFLLQGVMKSVPADAAYVNFVSWNRSDRAGKAQPVREYAAFVLRPGQPVHYYALGQTAAIDSDIDALKTGVLSNHTRGFLVESPGKTIGADAVDAKLKDMYGKIVAPLAGDIAGAQQLLIVPDGKLTLAPISALLDAQGHPLLEKHTITYMGSWRDIYQTVFWGPGDGASLPVIVANPDFNFNIGAPVNAAANSARPVFTQLPGAELEAKDIEQALQIPAYRVLIGDASRKWLIQSLESPGILHFATHTVPSLAWKAPVAEYNLFDVPQPSASQNPLMQSFIALAGANHQQSGPEDGILTGLEVSRLHLNGTGLVVLSTCESGQGTQVEGLGVIGLRAAFAMAGAQHLVMTLWPVDDAAGRQFMQFFYAHLNDGPASALRLAQLDMINKTQYKNPFYWSGYVISGAPEVHSTAAKPASPAAAAAPVRSETFITPRCFEIFMSSHDKSTTYFQTFRLEIGGDVYRNQSADGSVAYDLSNPGNTIVERNTQTMSGGPRQLYEIKGEGRDRWTANIVMKPGEMDLRFGRRSTDFAQREVIAFKGAGLFKNLDIPETFPPVSSFTAVTDSYNNVAKLDKIAACAATPSW